MSPITPQNSIDKIGNRGQNQPKAKLVGRFTRSMAKTTFVKTLVIDKVQVETVVLDEEELGISLPIDDNVVQPEVVSNPANETLPVIDRIRNNFRLNDTIINRRRGIKFFLI